MTAPTVPVPCLLEAPPNQEGRVMLDVLAVVKRYLPRLLSTPSLRSDMMGGPDARQADHGSL